MKMTNALIALLFVVSACDTSKTTPGGLEYKVHREGAGEPAPSGHVLVFNYRMTDSNDSVWVDTFERGLPDAMAPDNARATQSGDKLEELLSILTEGDSVSFSMSIKELFQSRIPPQIDTTLSLSFVVSVLDIVDQQTFQQETGPKIYEDFQKKQLGKDTVKIDKHLAEKGIVASKTESGLRYVVTQEGSGPELVSGQTASVHYAGYLLDGRYFDTSRKDLAEEQGLYNPIREPYAPFDVIVDRSSVISGWHDALKHMKKGTRATFYIPST